MNLKEYSQPEQLAVDDVEIQKKIVEIVNLLIN